MIEKITYYNKIVHVKLFLILKAGTSSRAIQLYKNNAKFKNVQIGLVRITKADRLDLTLYTELSKSNLNLSSTRKFQSEPVSLSLASVNTARFPPLVLVPG